MEKGCFLGAGPSAAASARETGPEPLWAFRWSTEKSSCFWPTWIVKALAPLASTILQGKAHLCIPFLGIARPQSQFQHSCVCERLICIFPGSVHIFPCSRIGRPILKIYMSHRYMRAGTGREIIIIIILFWKYSNCFISGNT